MQNYKPIEFRVSIHNIILPSSRQDTFADSQTHNLNLIYKPLEVVFLDVHQAGDVGDVEAVVLHVVGLQVYLVTPEKEQRQCL